MDQKLLEEERQLAAQREKEEREAEEKEAAAAKEEAAPVEKPPTDGLDQLSQLLKSTSAYTEFLFKTLNEKKQEVNLRIEAICAGPEDSWNNVEQRFVRWRSNTNCLDS